MLSMSIPHQALAQYDMKRFGIPADVRNRQDLQQAWEWRRIGCEFVRNQPIIPLHPLSRSRLRKAEKDCPSYFDAQLKSMASYVDLGSSSRIMLCIHMDLSIFFFQRLIRWY